MSAPVSLVDAEIWDRFVPDPLPVMSDIDGVLAIFSSHFHADMSAIDGIDYPAPSTEWNFFEAWGWSGEQFRSRFEQWALDGGYRRLAEHPNSFDPIRRLIEAGQHVHFLTSRHAFAADDTFAWLSERLPRDGWTLEVEPGPKSGGHRFCAAIDDYVGNAETLARTGCGHAALLTRPWNLHAPASTPRYASVAEFVETFVAARTGRPEHRTA